MSTQLSSLRRFLAGTATRRRGGPQGPALIVGSGKGGTGTSTVAALLALAGAAEGRRTLLIDADRELAVQHLLLGIAPGPGIGALREGHPVESLLTPAAPSLELLTCSPDPAEAESPPGLAEWQPLLRRLPGLYSEFDLVIIDIGSRLGGLRTAASLGAGRLLAVAAPDRITLAATHALIKGSTTHLPGLPAMIVFNQGGDLEARAAFDIVREGVGRFLARNIEFGGALPSDPQYRRGIEGGETIQVAATHATLADSVVSLASRILSPERSAPAQRVASR